MIKYCIFDLDGTLLDTLGSIGYYLNNTLSANGYSELTREECREYIGNGAKMLVRRALKKSGEEREEVITRVLSQYSAAYDKAPYYLTVPYDGIMELIAGLKARGVTLAVLSNKPNSTTQSVVREFFADGFQLVRGALDGVPLKPEPAACLALMEIMGAAPNECAFIGDTGVDIETGKRASVGLKIGVSWGFRDTEELLLSGADKIAQSSSDILKFVCEVE